MKPTNKNWKRELLGCIIFLGSLFICVLSVVGVGITSSLLWMIPAIVSGIIWAVYIILCTIKDILYD